MTGIRIKTPLDKLVKTLDPFESAILYERILKIMELTVKDIERNPDNWKNSLVKESVFFKLHEKIFKFNESL